LLQALLLRYHAATDKAAALVDVRVTMDFLHYLRFNAMRSSPVTYRPALAAQYIPCPSDQDAAALALAHLNDENSFERQNFERLGICTPWAQMRELPSYTMDAKRTKRVPRPQHGSREKAKSAGAKQVHLHGGRRTVEGDKCNHQYQAGTNLTGGAFVLNCKHGIGRSFFLLPTAEGSKFFCHLSSDDLSRSPGTN